MSVGWGELGVRFTIALLSNCCWIHTILDHSLYCILEPVCEQSLAAVLNWWAEGDGWQSPRGEGFCLMVNSVALSPTIPSTGGQTYEHMPLHYTLLPSLPCNLTHATAVHTSKMRSEMRSSRFVQAGSFKPCSLLFLEWKKETFIMQHLLLICHWFIFPFSSFVFLFHFFFLYFFFNVHCSCVCFFFNCMRVVTWLLWTIYERKCKHMNRFKLHIDFFHTYASTWSLYCM